MTADRTPTRTSSGPSGTQPHGRDRLAAILVGFAAVTLGLAWLGLLFLRYREGTWLDGAWVFADEAWAFDLSAYLGAARRLTETGSLYAVDIVAAEFEPGPAGLYYYAPPLGVAMLALADLSLPDSSTIWWLLRVGAVLLACAAMPVRPLLRAMAFMALALSLPALKDSVIGNVSLLLILPMVAAWRWMDRPAGSVLMAVAVSLRPALGLFLIWQLLRRRWRAALWTASAGVTLVLVTLPFVGFGGYLDYLNVLQNAQAPTGISENRDLGALTIALGADAGVAAAARLLGALAAVMAMVLSLRRERETSYMVVLCASLLIVPLLWDHYLATLIVPAAFLAQRLWAPLVLLPLLAWLPILSPLLVAATIVLLFFVEREAAVGAASRSTTASAT